MNDHASHRASTLPPFGGVALWQAADALLCELFGVPFDFWAFCEEWQLVLERSPTFSVAPDQARLRQGGLLCERVASTARAQCCQWDESRMLLGVPVVEHGHLHLIALAALPSTSRDNLSALAAMFDQRWAQREVAERQRDADWQWTLAVAELAEVQPQCTAS